MKKFLLGLVVITLMVTNPSFVNGETIIEGGHWELKSDMPTPRTGLAVEALNGKVYAVGGKMNEADTSLEYVDNPYQPDLKDICLKTVEVYDPATDSWVTKRDMPTARYDFGLVELNGKLYAIGGFNNEGYHLNLVEEYDPKTDTWTQKASMKIRRSKLAVVALNDKIYAIGGSNYGSGCNRLNTVEEYDPITDKWTMKAHLNHSRKGISGVVANGKIYAIGGLSTEATTIVEEYNPSTYKWTIKKGMSTARILLDVEELDGTIYAIGGESTGIVEAYDPKKDSWSIKEPLPYAALGHGVAEVNGKLYVIGGKTEDGRKNRVQEFTRISENEDSNNVSVKIIKNKGVLEIIKKCINFYKSKVKEFLE